jgi:hypothetical protein
LHLVSAPGATRNLLLLWAGTTEVTLLRLLSDDQYDVQIAYLNLFMLHTRATGEEMYVGMCGCEGAIANKVIVLSPHGQERCVFCKAAVQLAHIPHFPPLERRPHDGQATT